MLSVIELLVLSVCFYFLSILITGLYNIYLHPLRKIPGPFLNRFSLLPWYITWIKGDLHRNLLQLHQVYGDVIRTGPNEISIISPVAYQEIPHLSTIHRDQARTPSFLKDKIDVVNYNYNDEDHLRFRKALLPGLTGTPLQSHAAMVRRHTSDLIAALKQITETEGRTNVSQIFTWFQFDVTIDLLWGSPFNCLKKREDHPWLALLSKATFGKWALLLGIHPWLKALVLRFAPRRILEFQLDTVRLLCKQHSDSGKSNGGVFGLARKDLMTVSETEANFVALGGAGTDPPSLVLTAVVFYLARNKEYARRAREEVRSSFSSEGDIDFFECTRLPYLRAVITETFRIFPNLPSGVPRVVTGPSVVLDGHTLRRGTIIRLPQYCVGLHPTYFRDPTQFRPERWLNHPSFDSDRKDLIAPFSSGRNMCIAKQFSEMEIAYVIARLLWTLEWEVEDEFLDIRSWSSNHFWERQPVYVSFKPAASNSELEGERTR